MIRYMVAGLAMGMLSLGLAAPARAESVASCRSETVELLDGTRISRIEANKDVYETQLRRMGYNVDYVEDWGGCVKAVIDDPGGGSHMAFFDPDTLDRLTTN